MEYKNLQNIQIEKLHKTFLDAFSDYTVNMDLSVDKFNSNLKRKGFSPEISIGAFENGNLVGFILNGLRNINGKLIAYDIGTGVKIDFRRQKITTNMFVYVKKILKDKKIDKYILEVITTNISALNFYKKEGFRIKRKFNCFELNKKKFNFYYKYKVENLENLDLKPLSVFWDFTPSWQNSIDSINNISKDFVYSVVYSNKEIVSYGIINKNTGDIPEIAVNKNFRNQNIGISILSNLIENTNSNIITINNIDDKSTITMNFLTKLGFENTVSQYEMILII